MGLEYNITYRKKNKGLQAIISYKDSNGKWKQKSKQGFEDSRQGKRKAKDWALSNINNLEASTTIPIDYKNITFRDYCDEFINHISITHSDNTIKTYNIALSYFEELNNIELNKLTNIYIQKCVDKMRSKLSDNTIALYIDKLNAILNNAVENDVILKNPCKVKIKKTKSNKIALTSYEVNNLLTEAKKKNYKYYIIISIAVKCGLRRGEILGLTTHSIFKDHILVYQQYRRNNDTKEWELTKLKTNNSERTVPISIDLYNELIEYQKKYPVSIDGRLFNHKDAAIMSTSLTRFFKKIGYNITLHELRHTYTTLLIQNGLDFKTVASLIGDDVSQVMATYSHVNDEMKEKASTLIQNLF